MWNSCNRNEMWRTESYLNEKTGILIDIDNKKQLTTAMGSIITNYDNMNLKS